MSGSQRSWWSNPSTWILAITLFGAVVRLTNIDWDQNHFFHPDERRIAYAVQDLSFRPLQLNPKFFAYGSFPIYLDKIASSLLGLIDPRLASYDSVVHTARAVSGVIGTLTVLLTILLGMRLYDRNTGLLAGLLLAACVLHVQNSHFGTVDITLTFMVLLALYSLVGVVREARWQNYIYAGLAIGFAGATKASAFPLMLPLAIAGAARLKAGDRLGPVALRLLVATLAVFVAFAIGQPYALLDFKAFTHDLLEQSNMVRNAGLFPYTNQYVGTAKYGYDLGQLILCGMAPPLGLAAVWASGRRVIGAWRERAEELMLLAWVVPFFLVTGWFEVKFIRYLLPIYPIMILWAADWLMQVYRRRGLLGRLLLPGVVGGTLAALLAFLSIYAQAHTAVRGSEWVYKFIPAGSKILTQDWDEGFPMPLPGYNAERYKVVPFGYYEPDSPAKMQKLARALSDSGYLAFQTKRLYGALTQAAQKFPLSSNYFYLLFSGDLGFTLIHEVASRPTLFGIQFPDELVDESFTVYDHPKVLIFRNDGHLSSEQLYDKIMHGLPSKPMTRNQLLLARPGTEVGGGESEPIGSSLPALLTFVLLVEGLGLATYPLIRRWLPGVGAYALAKVLGILLFAYVPWLLVSLGQADFSRGTLLIMVLAIAVAGGLRWSRGLFKSTPRSEWLGSEALFWGVFSFFLLVRAFNPEIYWGEKPMDFSFLNALTRATTLPPPEPWFAGHDLNYSYFGYYITAALGKACHIAPAITFNLGIALFASLTAVSAFALGSAISRRWSTGLLTAAFTLLLGNLAGPRELLHRGHFNFDYFWATSRVIKDTINEFPLWSFLFADLHAHVMVMPFSLAFLCLCVLWVRQRFGDDREERSAALPLLALTGMMLGSIMVTNAWSTPTYVLFFPFLLGCHWLATRDRRGLIAFVWQLLTRVLAPAVIVVVLAYAFYAPFWLHFTPPERNWGWELGTLAKPGDFFTIFGLFFYALIPFLVVLWVRELRWRSRARSIAHANRLAEPPAPPPPLEPVATLNEAPADPSWAPDPAGLDHAGEAWEPQPPAQSSPPPLPATQHPVAVRTSWFRFLRPVLENVVLFAVVGSVFWFVGLHPRGPYPTIGVTRCLLLALALLTLELAVSRHLADRRRIPLVMMAFACFVTAGCDFIYVWDRMNTIFKFYLDSWFLLAPAAAAAAATLWRGRLITGVPRRLWQAGMVAVAGVALFTGVTDTYGVLTTNRVATPKPTLNGMLYLEERAPYELAAYRWLNQRINGIPVILEAYGPSYQEFARVSMNTGLPTVLGWDYHVYQRANPWSDINRRKTDVKLLYTSDNETQVRAALERYHVSLVYVGPLERRTYNGGNLERFKSWSDLLTPVYENAAVSIFAVSGQFTGAIPVTTVEEVPRVTTEEAGPPPQEAEGQLRQPRGVALDGKGAIYVCDFGNARIQKFGPTLQFELGWGEHGELPGQFKDPCGVAVGPKDTVYVADTWNQRVQVFSSDGHYEREWAASFYGPRGIAVDRQGAVFVTDSGNNRIVRFTANGEQQAAWGGKGTEPGKFSEPVGIAVDHNDKVYVCDNANGRLQMFTRDGGFIGSFPVPGWESKVFSEPYVAIDPLGRIWVTVPLLKEIRAYNEGGKLLRTITGQSVPTAKFETPMGIAVDTARKDLVVTDLEHRVVRTPYGEEH